MPTFGQANSVGWQNGTANRLQSRLNVSFSNNDPVAGTSDVTITIQYRRTASSTATYSLSAPWSITINNATQSGYADLDCRGFTVDTWYNYTSATFTGVVSNGAYPISGYVNLSGTTAQALSSSGTIPQTTISFNGNGNSGGSMSSYTITSGISKKIPYNAFTKTGYNFAGWRVYDQTDGTWRGNNSSGTDGYYPASEISSYYVYADYTSTAGRSNGHPLCFYAQWSIASYTLTVNPNGGSWNGSSSSQTFTQNYGTTKTIANPTKTGSTFNGWTKSGSGSLSGTTFTYGAGNTTLTANWTVNTYTVSYNANGGSGAPSAQIKSYGATLTLSKTIPTRTGYTFQGWATSSNGSVAYAAGSVYSTEASVTLYAVWTANTYTITYKANGGSGSDVTQSVTYGKSFTTKSSSTFTYTAHALNGWSTSASGSVSYNCNGSYTYNTAGNLTLYAVWVTSYWTPIIKHIIYRISGATNISKTVSDTNIVDTDVFDQSYALVNIPGYECENCFYNSTGQSFDFGTTFGSSRSSDLTYEIHYYPKQYSITYNLNQGHNTPRNPETYTLWDEITLTNPTRSGYKFDGWYLNGTQITGINDDCMYEFDEYILNNLTLDDFIAVLTQEDIHITGDITLEAHWTISRQHYEYVNGQYIQVRPFEWVVDKWVEVIMLSNEYLKDSDDNFIVDENGNRFLGYV